MAFAGGKRTGQTGAVGQHWPSFPAAVSVACAKGGRRRGRRLPKGGRHFPGAGVVSHRDGALRSVAPFHFIVGPNGLMAGVADVPVIHLDDEHSRYDGRRTIALILWDTTSIHRRDWEGWR